MLRISGMTVVLLSLRNRMEVPDNASHFRDDGANIWVFGTASLAKERHPREGTSSPRRNVIPARKRHPRAGGDLRAIASVRGEIISGLAIPLIAGRFWLSNPPNDWRFARFHQ